MSVFVHGEDIMGVVHVCEMLNVLTSCTVRVANVRWEG